MIKFPAACGLSLLLTVAAVDDRHAGAAQQTTGAATADAVLKARVQAALAGAADVPGREMTVDVKGAVVSVTGTVATPSEQQSVGAIVRAVPGVKDVRFSMRIEPPPPAGRGAAPAGRGGRGGRPPAA